MFKKKKFMRRKFLIFPTVFAFSLTSCMYDVGRVSPFSLEHTYNAVQQQNYVTETKDTQADFLNNGWWTLYEDEELNTLILLAFTHSPDINQIRARLSQAKALHNEVNASRLPTLDVQGERNTQNGNNAASSEYELSGLASFELDLWGKNSADAKSEELETAASRQDLYAGAVSLAASIVENWLDIHSLLEQERLLRKQIDVSETVLGLQQKRFEMGSASALDILQQEEKLAQSQAQLPDILSQQKQAANNIAILLGDTPYESLQITEKPFPQILPIPETGLASDLLNDRPDVTAAWLRVASADWASKSAWANRLPQFDISATLSTSATKLDNLFNSWLLNMAAGFAAPIFDGGSRKTEQLRQEALADENFHAYRAAVLNAVVDVENALVKNTYQDQKMMALQKQLDASKRTLEQAQLSYTNGDSDYINVLNSLNNTQSLEQSIVNEKLVQAKNRVGLYRALGGRSWLKKIEEQTPEGVIKHIYEGQKNVD